MADNTEKYVLRVPEDHPTVCGSNVEKSLYQQMPNHVGADLVVFDKVSGQMITRWIEGPILAETFFDLSKSDLISFMCKRSMTRYLKQPEHTMLRSKQNCWSGNDDFSYLEPLDPPIARPCHNDLNPWNVIVSEDNWKTLDWEFVGLNDPLFDLVALHQGLELAQENLFPIAEQFLGYREEDRVLSNLKRFWSRELAWAEYQLGAGNKRPEIFQQRTTARAKLKGPLTTGKFGVAVEVQHRGIKSFTSFSTDFHETATFESLSRYGREQTTAPDLLDFPSARRTPRVNPACTINRVDLPLNTDVRSGVVEPLEVAQIFLATKYTMSANRYRVSTVHDCERFPIQAAYEG